MRWMSLRILISYQKKEKDTYVSVHTGSLCKGGVCFIVVVIPFFFSSFLSLFRHWQQSKRYIQYNTYNFQGSKEGPPLPHHWMEAVHFQWDLCQLFCYNIATTAKLSFSSGRAPFLSQCVWCVVLYSVLNNCIYIYIYGQNYGRLWPNHSLYILVNRTGRNYTFHLHNPPWH